MVMGVDTGREFRARTTLQCQQNHLRRCRPSATAAAGSAGGGSEGISTSKTRLHRHPTHGFGSDALNNSTLPLTSLASAAQPEAV